jgi:hypothetical protein
MATQNNLSLFSGTFWGWVWVVAEICAVHSAAILQLNSTINALTPAIHQAPDILPHSHQIFNVLSHSPAVCCYHFCTSSRQHKWICFLSMSSTTLSRTACLFSGLSPVHRYFLTLTNLLGCIINTHFHRKWRHIIFKETDPTRFYFLHKGDSDY